MAGKSRDRLFAPLDEFLINIKETLPTFSFSFVQNRSTPLQSQVFVSEVELGGEDGRDAGHFHPLDQHSGYKRENYRRTRWRQRGANQEENWTLRIVSDDWSWIGGDLPDSISFSNSPNCYHSHQYSRFVRTSKLLYRNYFFIKGKVDQYSDKTSKQFRLRIDHQRQYRSRHGVLKLDQQLCLHTRVSKDLRYQLS